MTNSQKLSIRLSEIRQRLNEISGLEGDAFTAEIRAESDKLQSEFRDKETQYRAAVIAEGEAESRAATDGEGAELRALLDRASLGTFFQAAVEGRGLDGREVEIQQHFGLAGNAFPVELLRGPVEHRAVTPAPADVGASQRPIVQPIFATGDAAFLGVTMPTVGAGDSVFPVLTSRPTVGGPHSASEAVAETTGAFAAEVLSPGRLQASFFWRRTDAARFAGLGEALRMALASGLSEALDSQVISRLETDVTQSAASAADTFLTYRSRLIYGLIDGRRTKTESDIKLLLGADTLADMSDLYRGAGGQDQSAVDSLRELAGGVRASAHIAATSAHKQDTLVRRGSGMDFAAPIWRNVALIPDEISGAGKGEIKVTAVLLAAFKVTRAGGFARVQAQHE